MHTLQMAVGGDRTPTHLTQGEIKFTNHQWRELKRIVQAEEFDFACSIPSSDRNRSSPYHFLYYTKNGKLHITRLGQRRILAHVST